MNSADVFFWWLVALTVPVQLWATWTVGTWLREIYDERKQRKEVR